MAFKKSLYALVCYLGTPVFIGVSVAIALAARFVSPSDPDRPRLVWGPVPIISNAYWSKAMREAGYSSETFMTGFYGTVNTVDDFDLLLQDRYGRLPAFLKYYCGFFESLFRYDVYVLPFSGFFLGYTPYWWMESLLLRCAGRKAILIPYGADAYVYRNIRSIPLAHALLLSYPQAGRLQDRIERQVRYWTRNADFVVSCVINFDGLGRWDALVPSPLVVDLKKFRLSLRQSPADGTNDTVYIAHAPNHRGFKGTEFIVQAVDNLKKEGLKVELILIERMQNSEVLRILSEDADILIDQIIVTGHGINALEGMATGLPVISNLEDQAYIQILRRWSYFSECPLVSATPETLIDTLRALVKNPALRHHLGAAGRAYIEKYHDLDSGVHLFTAILDHLYGRRESLLNLYHPISGDYNKRRPLIKPPLKDNKIDG